MRSLLVRFIGWFLRQPVRRQLACWSALIFLVSVATRAAFVAIEAPYRRPLHFEMDNIAISLALGRGFADPFLPDRTGPSAWYPPIYPLALSAIFSAFGTGPAGELGKYAFHVTGVSLGYAALPWLARWAGLSTRIGIASGLFGSCVPVHVWNEIRGADMSWTGLLVILHCGFWLTLLRASRRLHFRSGLAHGIAWGFTLLTSAATASILVACACASLLRDRVRASQWLRYLAALCFGLSLPVAPWIARNYLAFGELIPLRSNLGMELWISNNPDARLSHRANDDWGVYRKYHPFANRLERAKLAELGEVRYCRLKTQQALDEIRKHPRRFLWNTFQRVVLFWFPPPFRLGQAIVLWLLTLLAWWGCAKGLRARHHLAGLVLTMWLLFPLLYYFIQFDFRYRYPIYWSLLLMACYGVLESQKLRELAAGVHSRWLRHRCAGALRLAVSLSPVGDSTRFVAG